MDETYLGGATVDEDYYLREQADYCDEPGEDD